MSNSTDILITKTHNDQNFNENISQYACYGLLFFYGIILPIWGARWLLWSWFKYILRFFRENPEGTDQDQNEEQSVVPDNIPNDPIVALQNHTIVIIYENMMEEIRNLNSEDLPSQNFNEKSKNFESATILNTKEAEVGPSEDDLADVGPSEDDLADVGPAEDDLAEVGPSEDDLVEVGPSEDDLTEVVSLKSISSSARGSDECLVCISAFKGPQIIRKLCCEHYYHIDCIDKWIIANGTCPKCRMDIYHPDH